MAPFIPPGRNSGSLSRDEGNGDDNDNNNNNNNTTSPDIHPTSQIRRPPPTRAITEPVDSIHTSRVVSFPASQTRRSQADSTRRHAQDQHVLLTIPSRDPMADFHLPEGDDGA